MQNTEYRSFFCEMQRYFVGNQTVSVPIDFHVMVKTYNGIK